MKPIQVITVFLLMLGACAANRKQETEKEQQKVVYLQQDSIILENVLQELAAAKDSPTSVLIQKAGEFFKETPYVAHTLESEEEQLIVNLRELDCTTYAENCLALANTVKSGNPSLNRFTEELKRIRYRGGRIDGYLSRLHYFSDWIHENEKKGLIKNVSKEIASMPYTKTVNFMSTHPESYRQLKDSTELVEKIAEKEQEISEREMYYIPEEKISDVEHLLQEGDIAGITTGIEGLDISHVVILVRKNGRMYPMHASTSANKVIVDDRTLQDYLLNSKSATGVMVARPL